MILKKHKMADLQLYVLTTLVIAVTSPTFAQNNSKTHEQLRAAFQECRTELGLPAPTPGERPQAPDEETKAKIDTCLKEKGFERPKFDRPPRGERLRPSEDSEGGGNGGGFR